MHQEPEPNFRGFVWEPTTEQEVVVLFGILLHLRAFETPLCIERVRTTFPDCTAVNLATGRRINIEFEYGSREFLIHTAEWKILRAAEPNQEWWLVCWRDDLSTANKAALSGLRVLSLSEYARARALVLNWSPSDASDRPEKLFAWRAGALHSKYGAIIAELKAFGEHERFFHIE